MAPRTRFQFSLITFAGNIPYIVKVDQLSCTPSNFFWPSRCQHDLEYSLEMAELKMNPATRSSYALDETIVFLRPSNEDAILGVNATENDNCRFEIAPPEEPTDRILEKTLDEELAETTSEVAPQSLTPVMAAPHVYPFALRLGFDTIDNPPPDGYTVGGSRYKINLPILEAMCNFVIHYVMQSGALMITAHVPISIGDTDLEYGQSLLLMHGSKIRYKMWIS